MPPSREQLARLDESAYRAIRGLLLGREGAEKVLLAIVRAESHWPLAGTLILVFARGRRRAWVRSNIRMTTAFMLAKLLSYVIGRPRPRFADCPPARDKDDGQSMPSTHATVAFAAAVSVPPLVPAPVMGAVAISTSLARVLLGEHYPSDICAGALLGSAVALALRS
jgi:membrane-associated phospholipid phosphatase